MYLLPRGRGVVATIANRGRGYVRPPPNNKGSYGGRQVCPLDIFLYISVSENCVIL